MARKRGYSAHTAKQHAEVRRLYRERVTELGEMAKHTSKSYFIDYIVEKTEYSAVRVAQILNSKPTVNQ